MYGVKAAVACFDTLPRREVGGTEVNAVSLRRAANLAKIELRYLVLLFYYDVVYLK
jgi:hypothetical protein